MEKIELLNKKINKLFRQLGKDVYNSTKEGRFKTKDIDKTINKIDKYIKEIESINSEKIILSPEKNEEGLSLLLFCKKCHVGNNPASTHCIKCGAKLKL